MFPIRLPETPPPTHQQRWSGNHPAFRVTSQFPLGFALPLSFNALPSTGSVQFDLNFVEVHRVRRFCFTPRHCQSDSDLELDLRENGKRQIFSQICRDHPACGCTPAYSSWNCDGEILTHTAIDVRYHSHRHAPHLLLPPVVSHAECISSVSQSALPVDQTVRTRDWRANRVWGSHQPLCNIAPPVLPLPVKHWSHRLRVTFAFWQCSLFRYSGLTSGPICLWPISALGLLFFNSHRL